MALPFAAPTLLVLACVAIACGALYREFAWCVPACAVLALVGSYALARSRLIGISTRSRFGWCGALPTRPRATTGALLALTVAALAVAVLVASLLLVVVATPAPHPDAMDIALLALDGGLAVGVVAAMGAALRKGAVARSHHADGIREPLFALPWLNDSHLPHLLDWQRRAALVRWRSGGNALVAVVLVAIPDSASIPQVVGLVLLVASLVWFDVAVRASAKTTVGAARLLAATPLTFRRMRRSSLRYPLVAAVCAVVLAVIGVMLMAGGFADVLIWCACAIAASVWPLHGIVRATHPGDST